MSHFVSSIFGGGKKAPPAAPAPDTALASPEAEAARLAAERKARGMSRDSTDVYGASMAAQAQYGQGLLQVAKRQKASSDMGIM